MIQCEFEDGNRATLRHVVVDSIILRGEKVLLVKRAENLIEGGKWALPGGYVDRDENIQEATLRELREETGFEGIIENLFCIISYPFRSPFDNRQNIVFAYIVRVENLVPKTFDTEVTECKWMDLNSIPTETLAFDHGKIIRKYQEHQTTPLSLPVLIDSKEDY